MEATCTLEKIGRKKRLYAEEKDEKKKTIAKRRKCNCWGEGFNVRDQ